MIFACTLQFDRRGEEKKREEREREERVEKGERQLFDHAVQTTEERESSI